MLKSSKFPVLSSEFPSPPKKRRTNIAHHSSFTPYTLYPNPILTSSTAHTHPRFYAFTHPPIIHHSHLYIVRRSSFVVRRSKPIIVPVSTPTCPWGLWNRYRPGSRSLPGFCHFRFAPQSGS